jgi:hypothetical protein
VSRWLTSTGAAERQPLEFVGGDPRQTRPSMTATVAGTAPGGAHFTFQAPRQFEVDRLGKPW